MESGVASLRPASSFRAVPSLPFPPLSCFLLDDLCELESEGPSPDRDTLPAHPAARKAETTTEPSLAPRLREPAISPPPKIFGRDMPHISALMSRLSGHPRQGERLRRVIERRRPHRGGLHPEVAADL